jgi:hypothetical protein
MECINATSLCGKSGQWGTQPSLPVKQVNAKGFVALSAGQPREAIDEAGRVIQPDLSRSFVQGLAHL